MWVVRSKKKQKGKVEEGGLGQWECQLCVALMSAVLSCFSDTYCCSFHPTHCDSFKSARTHRGWWQSHFTGAHLSGNHKTRGPVWGLASQSEKCFYGSAQQSSQGFQIISATQSPPAEHSWHSLRTSMPTREVFFPSQNYLLPVNILMV